MDIAIYTLGCKVNQVETQAMERELLGRGHRLVDFDGPADAYIVNTCTVTAVSDKKCRNIIRRARKRAPDGVVAVCGCYAQTGPEAVAALGADLVSGSAGRMAFLDRLEGLEGRLFIPSHGEVRTDISLTVKKNREKVFEIADLLKDICKEEAGTEEVIQKVFDRYGLVMDANQYVLVGATLRSYLSWMKGLGEMDVSFRGNRLWWHSTERKDDAGHARLNQDKDGLLKNIDCFALDMDGTIYLGERWIDGAREFLEEIEKRGKRYLFLTNNSSKSPDVYVEKLKRMGLEAGTDKIVTSGQATVFYLKKHYPGKRVFLLGNDLLKKEFEEEGVVLDEENPEIVVTAFDTTLDYGKMCRVCDLVRAGLPYIATHPDYNCPTEDGFIPDAGAIHAFIHASAGRYPDRVIGKPNGDIIDYLLERAGTERGRTAMVGDRLYTDIAAGRNHGLKSVLVLSGEASAGDVEKSEVKPDLVFQSVREMIPYL